MGQAFRIGDVDVPAGERRLVELKLGRQSTLTPVTLPIHVVNGSRPGPTAFVSAAIHGDEINGVEIARRLLRGLAPGRLAGTLLVVPIVNGFGFVGRSRYLPDRRDLNRSFPGSANGSLAARLAHLFFRDVVLRTSFGIDLHTAAIGRVNLPQIRSTFETQASRDLGTAFGAPILLRSEQRAGSLRQAARDHGVEVLVYEGGEGLRFDEYAIKAGVEGILRVMEAADMLTLPPETEELGSRGLAKGDAGAARGIPEGDFGARAPVLADASKWVRAPEGGVLRSIRRIGEAVGEGEVVGTIASPYEDGETPIRCPRRGIIIGRTTLPIVNLGDALFHVAWSEEIATGRRAQAQPPRESASEPVMDEDEII